MQETPYNILVKLVKDATDIQKKAAELSPECAVLFGPILGELERVKALVGREQYNRVVKSFVEHSNGK